MTSPRVAIVVDNPGRDLPGLVLTARRLCEQGATCLLVPFDLWWRELWQLAPDLVVVNYLRSVNQETVRQAAAAGIGVAILDTEGGVFASVDAYRARATPDPDVFPLVQRFLSWGAELPRELVALGDYRSEQVVVTGQPRLDLYREPWRQAARRASPYVDRYGAPLVLLNGSFSRGNPRFASLEEEARNMVARDGYTPEGARAYQAAHVECLTGMARLANRLAARYPQASFVYRPHPFESLATYRELLEPLDNLHLVQEGPVQGWILRASAVIQSSCSTAIESLMADVPSLSPAWLPQAELFEAIEAVNVRVESEEAMLTAVGQALEGRFEIPPPVQAAFQEVVARWFHRIDGQSCDRVAEATLGCLEELGPLRKRRSRVLAACRRQAYDLTNPELSLANRVRAQASATLGLPVPTPPPEPAWRLEKRFYPEDVRLWLELLAQCRPGPALEVTPADEAGEYRFSDGYGRAVVVAPRA
jgi:surface carbohydrate biosynthesis protein